MRIFSFGSAFVLLVASSVAVAGTAAQAADAKPAAEAKPASAPAEVALQHALAKKVNADFINTPLRDAVAYLGEVTGAQILIDQRGLTDAGINPDDPVSLKVKDVSLKSALGLLLEQTNGQATYAIRHEVLQITSQERANSRMTTKVYPLGPLVDTDADLPAVIMAHVAPETWDIVGGQGAVHAVGGTLVVTQTYYNHETVGNLLSELRHAQEQRATAAAK